MWHILTAQRCASAKLLQVTVTPMENSSALGIGRPAPGQCRACIAEEPRWTRMSDLLNRMLRTLERETVQDVGLLTI